ncbi:unnamed protein product [Durusdinium trenchii]|uniref:Uncharacterized protein n=1 Tax=Durusdinium trenchii TaxID=1381693 RepID=A0ABP0R9W4_9DINO
MPELGQKRKCLDGAILPDMKFRRMRGKVPKKQQRALALVPLPSKSGIKDEPQVDLKLLPPGTFTDYLRLLRQKHPREKLSLKLFLKVWGQSFAHRLGIRPPSQHSTCGICKKHKMLLKRISNERARAGQTQEYVRRLKRTYADRVCYWTSRATSRLLFLPCGRRSFTMITDAMDKSKFKFPRSRVICSKEFQTFARPALDMSTIITHGHNCVIAVSGPPLEEGRIVGGGPIVPCDTPLGREVQRQGSRIHCPIGQLREGDEEQCSPPFLWPDDSTQEDISH